MPRRAGVRSGGLGPLCAALVVLAPFGGHAQTAPQPNANLLTASGDITVFHMFTGPDNMSHLEPMTLQAVASKFGGASLMDAGADRAKMGYSDDGSTLDYHHADHRTLLLELQGVTVFETGDGHHYRLAPGNMVLAEDHTGRGHRNRCEAPTGARQCLILQVTLRDDEVGLRTPAK